MLALFAQCFLFAFGNYLCVCVAVRTQMAAGGRLTKRWWSRWLRWRRGFRQRNVAAAKPARSRPCITLSTAWNKSKVTELHATHVYAACSLFDGCLSWHYLASVQHLCLCNPLQLTVSITICWCKMARTRGEMPAFSPWKRWSESLLSTRSKTR